METSDWMGVLIVLVVLLIGGVLGGYLVAAQANEAKNWQKWMFGGVAGALVAATLTTGVVSLKFEEIINQKDASLLLQGLLKLAGVAIVGGYLGERLVAKLAGQMLGVKEAKEAKKRTEILDALREVEARLGRNLPIAAMEKIRGLMDKGLSEDELATLRLMKAYALKRLGNLKYALDEVEQSLKDKETSVGWYNKACYLARMRSEAGIGGLDPRVDQALEAAVKLAGSDGTKMEILRSNLRRDLSENGDLMGYEHRNAVKSILDHVTNA